MALSTPDENSDDLIANNVPDLLANEQTWPTEEELMEAPAAQEDEASTRKVKRVPKGTSAYQAAWIFDDLDDEDDELDEGDDDLADEDMEDAHSSSGEYCFVSC